MAIIVLHADYLSVQNILLLLVLICVDKLSNLNSLESIYMHLAKLLRECGHGYEDAIAFEIGCSPHQKLHYLQIPAANILWSMGLQHVMENVIKAKQF
jgi:hypothetical protein